MSNVPPFEPPVITDEDISWATSLLELPDKAFVGAEGADPRQEVLKSMKPVDVAACPGSGKTTLLVAKLAILAKKWQYRTRGICVLSHTNAARHEIETHLGHTTVGRRLLAYPHYIGTIHGFVDEFLALPWLRSKGYPIKMVDTDICLERRWNALQITTQSGLEINHHTHSVLSVKSPDFNVGRVRWGRHSVLGTETNTYRDMKEVCKRTTNEGYFCYDEMFMWATDLIENVPGVVQSIRDRFPLLFIDEAQDNSEDQSAILHRIFLDRDGAVVRQRFGDGNQAIFDFMEAQEATTDKFPITSIDLPNSHRFGQNIAKLACPLGLISYEEGLTGQGKPEKDFFASNMIKGPHTIFLFDNDSISKVLDAYGELLLEAFSEEGLTEGKFIAVGLIHKDTGDDHKPRNVGHYLPGYDPGLTKSEPRPQTFVQYVFAGLGKSQTTGESYLTVEKIAEGILRLAGMAEGGAIRPHRRHKHRYVLNLLKEYVDARENYDNLIVKFAIERDIPTKETWNGHWRDVVRDIAENIAGDSLTNQETNAFLEWKDGRGDSASPPIAPKSRDNIYRFSKNGKKVAVRVGSIHSVKGETHTATLVLETFWHEHNLESIKDWLCADQKGYTGQGVRIKTRLKVHYVAMTRPTHLLCLAMKRSTFENDEGNLDHDMIEKLEARGWKVKQVEAEKDGDLKVDDDGKDNSGDRDLVDLSDR